MSERTDWERVLARIGALAVRFQFEALDGSEEEELLDEMYELATRVDIDPEGRAAVERMVAA